MKYFDLIYQDESLLVLNKPSGLLSVPGRGVLKHDSLQTRVQQLYPDALIVHRLDMSTSGIMVMARGKDAQRHLNSAFAQRHVLKKYQAVVHGLVEADYGCIELPLITDWPNRPRQKVDYINGKPACTEYKVISRDYHNNTTRLALMPTTGRSHQLRVHMMMLGHTILGDALYANSEVRDKAPRLLLHAEELCFAHPDSLQQVAFTADSAF